MQRTQRKVAVLLMLALGLAIWIGGTVFAADSWKMAVDRTPSMAGRNRPLAAGTVPHGNVNVQVSSNSFSPASVTINVGDTVTWTRLDGFHNVSADDGSFRLGEPNGAAGSSWTSVSHTFTQPGTFRYHCEIHGGVNGFGMSGVVIVQGNDEPVTGLAATNSSPTLLGDTTNFSATIISGTNVSYAWNFGDGGSGTGKTVSHTYPATGVYTATVTTTNSQGNQTASTAVHITNAIVNVGNNGSNFDPITTTIRVGDTVTWVRKAGSHNVRADDDSFRLGGVNGAPSSSWTAVSHKFTEAGTVRYYCQLHGAPNGVGMSGVVIVHSIVYLPLAPQ